MKLPGSILWRTFGVTTVALVLSTITTLALVEVYAGRPSLERRVAKGEIDPRPRSGRQELLEGSVNRRIWAVDRSRKPEPKTAR